MLKPYTNLQVEGRPRDETPGSGLAETGNAVALLTVASVILSTLVRVAWLTPLFHVAAVLPYYYVLMKHQRHDEALIIVARWTVALIVTTIVLGAFVPSRMDASQLLSSRSIPVLQAWLTSPQAPPPSDYSYMFWGLAVFLVGSLISGGVVGLIVASVGFGGAAIGALFLFEHGNNVVLTTLTAIPPWQWCIFACAVLLLVPTGKPFFDRFITSEEFAHDGRFLLICMYAGAACFVLALLLRITTAGLWHQLVQRWTIL